MENCIYNYIDEMTLLYVEDLEVSPIIKKYGMKAKVTDLAKSMGEIITEDGYCDYWTASQTSFNFWNIVNSMCFDSAGRLIQGHASGGFGVRPVLKSNNLKELLKYATIIDEDRVALGELSKPITMAGECIKSLNKEPIVWFVDEKRNILISEKVLLGNKSMDCRKDFKGHFRDTELYKFLNTKFMGEIFQIYDLEEKESINLDSTLLELRRLRVELETVRKENRKKEMLIKKILDLQREIEEEKQKSRELDDQLRDIYQKSSEKVYVKKLN